MVAQIREKFATQVKSEFLAAVRAIAQQEGRQLQVLVEEALSELVDRRKQEWPRAQVMAAYQVSHEKFASLYKKFAE